MLFWAKKMATLPFLPLYCALFCGLAATILFFTRRQKLAHILSVAAFLVLAVFSNRGVAALLLRPLETRHAPIADAPIRDTLPADVRACRAIVVLGGGHGDSPALSSVNQLSPSALSRLTEGIRLANLLPETKLVVCGYDAGKTDTHARVLERAALSLGFPASRLQRLDTPRDTHDEVLELARLYGSGRILVVTSAWHMPRAMALCRNAGLDPVAAPADFALKPDSGASASFLAWDLGALERSTKAIHERLGLLWSHLRGQI